MHCNTYIASKWILMRKLLFLLSIGFVVFGCGDKKKIIEINNHQDSIAKSEIIASNKKGTYFRYAGINDSVLFYYQQAVNVSRQLPDKPYLPDIYMNMAEFYDMAGDYPNAAGYYRQALLTADSLHYKESFKYPIYSGLAHVYINLKNFPMADYYLDMAEAKFDSMPPVNQQYFAVTKVNYYYNTKEYAQAIPWLYKADKIVKSMNHPFSQAIVDANFGEIYMLLNQPDSAQLYLDKAATVFLGPDSDPSAVFYINGLYASLALQNNDLRLAERTLSVPVDSMVISPSYIYFNDKRMEELFYKKGNYQKAYEYRLRADKYDDLQRNITIQNNIVEIDSRYRQDTTLLRRDVIIGQHEQRVLKLRNESLLIISILLFVILIASVWIIYYRKQKALQHSRQTAVIAQLRMENIRNRTSPHFIFNVLNAVMPSLRENHESILPLKLLVRAIREGLLASEKLTVELQEEIRVVSNYVELRKSMDTDTPQVNWDIEDQINTTTLIPSMIIQIPVENALKYAFDSASEDNKIDVRIFGGKEGLSIIIDDNGAGFEPVKYANDPRGTGNGLKILYKTIELLNTRNQQKIKFEINNKKNTTAGLSGTIVSFFIPSDYKYEL